jgi:hypothetical protein
VTYDLDGKYRKFEATAAIMDKAKQLAFSSELIFVVKGDGKELWRSAPLTSHGQQEPVAVNVEGVRRMGLEVSCRGSHACGWSVWLAPKLTP